MFQETGHSRRSAEGTRTAYRKHQLASFDHAGLTFRVKFQYQNRTKTEQENAPRCEGRGLELGMAKEAAHEVAIDDSLD